MSKYLVLQNGSHAYKLVERDPQGGQPRVLHTFARRRDADVTAALLTRATAARTLRAFKANGERFQTVPTKCNLDLIVEERRNRGLMP